MRCTTNPGSFECLNDEKKQRGVIGGDKFIALVTKYSDRFTIEPVAKAGGWLMAAPDEERSDLRENVVKVILIFFSYFDTLFICYIWKLPTYATLCAHCYSA
eukprot:Blabericola_migrator_1__3066@NODE_1896_length_3595_cov_19_177154_g1214_i0_p4_GENE_NODE_1896_length_3595_cov_19_177154_g1214_i0NODE_1896_length_3595_cov_19_177154_g1214_i0_p4_ORF_typecomplete_len102_score7_93_NODE_1896_length_3595_cov_19_177154_g1214_i026322937